MALRPVVSDLIKWLGLSVAASEGDGSPLDEVMAAARDEIESRCNLPSSALDADSDTYPRPVRLGVLMYAGRLYKRRLSPEGVAGFGDLGAIRILAVDPDIEALIGRFLKLDGFA